jgi:hypothetical protein
MRSSIIPTQQLGKCEEKGGLCIGLTHMIEPEVPWDNLLAIKEAVEIYEAKRSR